MKINWNDYKAIAQKHMAKSRDEAKNLVKGNASAAGNELLEKAQNDIFGAKKTTKPMIESLKKKPAKPRETVLLKRERRK